MKTTAFEIDINSHINALNWAVMNKGEKTIVKISFENLGFGDIKAIKFKAVAYDVFNNIIKVNGKDSFCFTIDNIFVSANTPSGELKVSLPFIVDHLEITENEVAFSDSTIYKYEMPDIRKYELEEFDNNAEDKFKLKVLREKYGEFYTYKARELDFGWVCWCGRYNEVGWLSCSRCSADKDRVLRASEDEVISDVLEEYKKTRKQRKKKTRFFTVTCGTLVILFWILVILLLIICITSSKT